MKFVHIKNTVYKILPLLYRPFCVWYFDLFHILPSHNVLNLSNVLCINVNNFIWMFGSAFILCSSKNSCLYRVTNVNGIPKFVPKPWAALAKRWAGDDNNTAGNDKRYLYTDFRNYIVTISFKKTFSTVFPFLLPLNTPTTLAS